MDPLNDNVASLLHQSSDHFVSELWKEGESDLLSFIHCHVQQTFNLCVRSVQICEKISFKLKNKNVVIPCIFFFFFKIVKYKERSLQVQNVLTISLPSPSLSFNYSIYLTVWSSLVLLPSCSLLCLLALFPFSLLFFSFPSSLIWCSPLSFPLIFLPAPSFFLHQIFKRFLVCTSLTPMPHYRPMAPTVGFSPPLCVTLTFLTPTSAYITPLFSVCPVFDCCVPLVSLFIPF